MDASPPVPPGFFGKVPARGDFLSRRVPAGLGARWEEWLAGLTTAAKEAAGPDWPDAWLTAPLWHFALGAALAPPHGAAGVLVASADRVGRLFPFTVVGGCDPGSPPDPAALLGWGRAVEELVLDALEDGFDPAALDAALAALGPPPPVTGPDGPPGVQALAAEAAQGDGIGDDALDGSSEGREHGLETLPHAGSGHAEVGDGTGHDAVAAILDDPPQASSRGVGADVASILGDQPEPAGQADERADRDGGSDGVLPPAAGAASAIGRPGAGQSVWWCRGSDRVAPVQLRCAGLPGPATGAAMVLGGAGATPG